MQGEQTVSARALALVKATPDGVESLTAALLLGVSVATVSSALARHFWRAAVDRRWDGRAYVYTPLGTWRT